MFHYSISIALFPLLEMFKDSEEMVRLNQAGLYIWKSYF